MSCVPGLHGVLIAFDGAALGLLHREPQRAEDAPYLGLAELDAELALDESAHALERPQLRAEAMVGRFVHEHAAQCLQLLLVQPCRTPSRGHGPQRIDAAFIEHGFPRICGLPRYTHRVCSLCGRLSRQQHSPSAQTPPYRFVQSLRRHASHPVLAKYRCNARGRQRLS
jgi:hypothetical protein